MRNILLDEDEVVDKRRPMGGIDGCIHIGYTMKRRAIRDLFHRGNRCVDVPSAQREGVYFGFQGEINLVLPDGFIV